MADEPIGIEWSEAVVIERDDAGRLIVALPKRAAERLGCSEGDVLSYTAFAGRGIEVWSIAKSPYSSLDDLEQGSGE
jgi:hypothetical protein